MLSLWNLRRFFQTGRKENGCYMGENECPSNASYRNLSCLPDEQLIELKQAALKFAEMIDETISERIIN